MKKSLICFLTAILMLSLFVSAGQTAPDASGNVVCSGQYTTKYNPEKLKAIMIAISDPDLVSEDTTDLVACEGTGMVRMEYRPEFAEGHFVEFAKIYGTVTATTSTKKIEIADGALVPLEFPEDRHVLYPLSIKGNSITLQIIKDTQQKIKPLFRIAGNPSYEMESIFFGCQKKDANGGELSCSMSGQLYNEGKSEKGYLTIAGYGFVSTKNAIEAYVVEHAANIQELKEKTEVESESDFVAIPITDLKEIKVTMPDLRDNSRLDLYAKAQEEASAIDSVRVKSVEEIKITDIIENYKQKVFYGDVGKVNIIGKDDVRAIISTERQNEGNPFQISLDTEDARASVYMSGSKLVESTGSIYVFSESAEEAYNSINEDSALEMDSILLKPSTKEIRIHSVDSAIDAYLLSDYETVTIVPQIGADGMESSVRVTNTRNNAWILYENDELTWTPGKTIAGLGFNFNVNLNPALGEDELLRCTTDGICWLGSTMVVNPAGLTQEKLNEGIENVRSSPRPRVVEEGAKGIGEGSEVTLGEKCDTDEDCGATEECDLYERVCVLQNRESSAGAKSAGGCDTDRDCDSTQRCLRRMCVEEETECIITDDCARGEICDRGQCLTSEEALGAKSAEDILPRQVSGGEFEEIFPAEEKGAFRRALDWIKGLFS